MAITGNLRDFTLTQLLELIHRGRKTGALSIGREPQNTRLYFREGHLIHASLHGAGSDVMGLLRKNGHLTVPSGTELPALSVTSSEKETGLMLINAGYATRNDILRAIRDHTLEVVYGLFTRREGEFLFEPNIAPPDGRITFPLRLENIILEGSRRSREKEHLEAELPSLEVGLRLSQSPDAALERVNLSRAQWRIISMASSGKTLHDIAKEIGMDAFGIRKSVHGLVSAGLVDLVRPAVPTTPTAQQPAPEERPVQPPVPAVARGVLLRLIDRVRRL